MRRGSATALAITCVLGSAACGQAQSPYSDYLRGRAYAQFLNSPYAYRTYSSFSPPQSYQSFGPFTAQGYRVDAGYLHQRITPFGFESYQIKPGYQAYQATPFTLQTEGVPSKEESIFIPRGAGPPPGNDPRFQRPSDPRLNPGQRPVDPPPLPGIGPDAPPAPQVPGPPISRWQPRQ